MFVARTGPHYPTRVLIVTQLERPAASPVFPCWAAHLLIGNLQAVVQLNPLEDSSTFNPLPPDQQALFPDFGTGQAQTNP